MKEECKDFYNYKVYFDGRVYSNYNKRFLNGEINKYGYRVYTLYINKNPTRYRANRLVALLFLDVPKNYEDLVVNHKDGNKLNNNYTNLEWVTYEYNNYHARVNALNNISESNKKRWQDDEFRYKVSKKISETQLSNNCNKRENNGRFKYKIFDSNNTQLYRDELPRLLNLAQSTIDRFIRESANGIENKYFKKLGIKVKIQK